MFRRFFKWLFKQPAPQYSPTDEVIPVGDMTDDEINVMVAARVFETGRPYVGSIDSNGILHMHPLEIEDDRKEDEEK